MERTVEFGIMLGTLWNLLLNLDHVRDFMILLNLESS